VTFTVSLPATQFQNRCPHMFLAASLTYNYSINSIVTFNMLQSRSAVSNEHVNTGTCAQFYINIIITAKAKEVWTYIYER
jgi:hypothetical protein